MIEAPLLQQCGMGPFFHDFPFIQDQDAIGALNGAEPMRHDEGGAVDHQALQRFLHQPFGLRIQSGGGLVEQENSGILQNGSRNGDTLALTA